MKQIYLVFLMPIFKIKLSLTRNMSQHLRTCMGDTFAHDLHIFLVHRCTVASSSYIPTSICTAKNWETVESCLQTPGEAHNCDAVNASLWIDSERSALTNDREFTWLLMYLRCWNTLPSLKNEGPLKIIRYGTVAKTAYLRNHVHTMFSFLGEVALRKRCFHSCCARNRLHVPAALALWPEMQGENSLFPLLHFLAALRSLNLSKALKSTTGKTRTCPSSHTPLCFWKARLRTLSTPISSSALPSLLSSGAQWDSVLRRTQQR
jgi:hypothetical protein